MDQSMSPRKYLAVVALAVGMITDSWAAQRTILKALQACPNVKDFTDWFEAMEKGDASRAVDIIDGKGCVEVNKGEMVEFERLLTNHSLFVSAQSGSRRVSGHRRLQFHHNHGKRGAARSAWAMTEAARSSSSVLHPPNTPPRPVR